MGLTRTTIVWLWMFSILTMGCSSSRMIDAREDEREEMYALYAKTIRQVVTKEGTTYLFSKNSLFQDGRTTIVKDSIVGYSNGKRVSMLFSEVSAVYVTEFQPVMTVVAILGGVGIVVGIIVLLTAAHKAFSFGSL